MKGGASRFPVTRLSVIEGVRSADAGEQERAFGVLVEAYWKPVYKYLRVKWLRDHEDAADLTQEFFLAAMTKGTFDLYDPARARLRTFLRTCLDRFVQNRDRAVRAEKRGGAAVILSLDFETAEGELARAEPADPASPEDYFAREWARSFLGSVVEALRAHCEERGKTAVFEVFQRHDLAAEDAVPSYRDLSDALGVPVTTITNQLAHARREFRRIALERLRETSGSDREFREEARSLLGTAIE